MKKRGFTLTEIMVVLTVIGVIIALITPIIIKLRPDKGRIMFRKAYYVTERVVSELINDDSLYKDLSAASPGFVDQDSVNLNGTFYAGLDKFCKLFAEKVNTAGAIDCSPGKSFPVATANASLNSGNFTTSDGITWHLPTTEAAAASGKVFISSPVPILRDIIVDINGTSEYNAKTNPNCQYNATTCPKPDQFKIKVRYDGKITIDGTKEIEYLKNTSVE